MLKNCSADNKTFCFTYFWYSGFFKGAIHLNKIEIKSLNVILR